MRVGNVQRQQYEEAATRAERFGYYSTMGHLRYVVTQAMNGEDVDAEDVEQADKYVEQMERIASASRASGCAACEGDDSSGHTCDK